MSPLSSSQQRSNSDGRNIYNRTVVSQTVSIFQNLADEGVDSSSSSIKSNTADDEQSSRVLNLMMISCEENPPYGPSKETATMFVELLCQAYERMQQQMKKKITTENEHEVIEEATVVTAEKAAATKMMMTISITIYHAQNFDYPKTPIEWSNYDGIILPGSLSAAYDNNSTPWIEHLQQYVIQDTIHEMRLKTLGVCFGHQCFAHAFGGGGGKAVKCPTGSKAGRISCQLTKEGEQLLLLHRCCHPQNDNNSNSNIGKEHNNSSINSDDRGDNSIEMLYTHGDMIHSLPNFAIPLGGNVGVPIEACAYFASIDEKNQWMQQQQQQQQQQYQQQHNEETSKTIQPYAFTFQAHPEYISPTGFNINYINTVHAMEQRGYITHELSQKVCEDARTYFDKVYEDSLDVMIAVAVTLGWFKC
jgi:GMP synthase-like glutamine amidotransferase